MQNLTFDPALTATLAAAPTKLAWSNSLKSALGLTRRLRCYRSVNAASSDPSVDGTEFMNIGMTGALTVVGGAVTGFGSATGTTVHLAADLLTGASCLRIEGNGHWVQGWLGLNEAAQLAAGVLQVNVVKYDFYFNANPTTSAGIGFKPSTSCKPPKLMPSGTGPGVPPPATTRPYTLELFDWTNPASPILRGTATLDTRVEDMVFEDVDLAANMGDIKVTQCSTSMPWGEFEFGGILLAMNQVTNDVVAAPVYQVLISCKPFGRWTSYPATDTYNDQTDVTCPPPFKVVLKDTTGVILHTFEMRDGLPINSPQLSQVRDFTNPLRPLWNCAMMLAWESNPPKLNSKSNKYHPGVMDSSRRPSMSRNGASVNGAIPLINGRGQVNSMNHWFAAPRWPMNCSNNIVQDALDPNNDPYVYDIHNYFTSLTAPLAMLSRATGWDYEPGAIQTHDWYTGPGGPRHDRAAVPTPLVEYLSNPSGARLRDGATFKVMAKAWTMGYFNHSHHYVQNVRTFDTMPIDQTVYGGWAYGGSYYGGNPSGYVPGGLARHVPMRGIPNASAAPLPLDRDGKAVWGGWSLDNLHTYCCPGLTVMLMNSPMHVITAKLRFNAHMMAQLLAANPTVTSGFMERNGAWRWLHWAVMWKIGTNHYLGIPRSVIEDRWRIDMELIYDTIVVPTTDPTNPDYNSDDSRLLRAVGQRRSADPVIIDTNVPADQQMQSYTTLSNGLSFYMSTVLFLMRTTGSFDVMYNKNAKCKAAIEFLIQCMDKCSIDFILDTDGRAEGYVSVAPGTLVSANNPSKAFCTSWLDWATNIRPKAPGSLEDWLYNADGSRYINGDRDPAQHSRAQWAFLRKDFFYDIIPNPRTNAAVAKYEGYYAIVTAATAAEPVLANKRTKDHIFLIPSFGRIKQPVA